MTRADPERGSAPVGLLSRLEPWEAALVLNLRLWSDGPEGQAEVWRDYRSALPDPEARAECCAFEHLLVTLAAGAHRPMARHDLGCACVGADEAVFAHLVRTASDGFLTDAALIATLMVGPCRAEQVALMAGQVGSCLRQMHCRPAPRIPTPSAHRAWLH